MLFSQKEGLEREVERLRQDAETKRREHEAELQRLRARLEGDGPGRALKKGSEL